MKILIFTDSRGQDTTAGKSFELFPQRLAQRADVDADIVAIENATLPDFVAALEEHPAENYDRVIVFAGLEDWRARAKSDAKALYGDEKKAAFDRLFTARSMTAYLGKGVGFDHEGEAAANLYGPEMARKKLVPLLKDVPNLLFVDATPASDGSDSGDLLAKYSQLFRQELGGDRYVSLDAAESDEDLLTDDADLTEAGNEKLYDRVIEALHGSVVSLASDPAPKSSSRKKPPLISVVVPVYNVKDYLRECLDSLVAQDDRNFEVVIIDDGSTDESPEIIAEYCDAHDNFRSHRQVNAGLGGARNSGFEIAEGDFITYLDSDDYVTSDYVSALRAAQAEGDHDIVSADFQRVNEAGDPIKPGVIQTHIVPDELQLMAGYQRLLGAFTPSVAWGRLYRRTLIGDHLLRFPEKLPHEDLFFTYKAFLFARSTARIARPLVSWRVRDGSLSRSIGEVHVEAAMQLWLQTEAFLRMHDHDELDHALAARRTLIFLRDIWNRSQRGSNPLAKSRYLDMFTRKVSDLEALIDLFEQSALAKTLDTAPLHAVVQALHTAQLERAAPCEPFNTIPTPDITWPHANVNLSVYPKKEYEGDIEPDTEKMRSYYNKYKGERCFIVGNGPSLNKHDLALLEGEYTFAVNSIFYKTEESGFVPTFFVVEDSKVMEENLERIAEYDAPHRFFPTKYREMVGERPNTAYYRTNWGFYQKSSANYCIPRFSVDASQEVFAGQTVTYANLQLAFFMGFTEVYLIGMDFDYVIPKEHIREGNHILSTTDDPNHFHKDYFGVGKTWKDPKLERVAMSYRQAKISFEAAGRRVYNATDGGKLEIFPRVNYNELLRDPTTGGKRQSRVSPRPETLGEGTTTPDAPTLKPAAPAPAPTPAAASNPAPAPSPAPAPVPAPAALSASAASPAIATPPSGGGKFGKLARDPYRFFADSRSSALRPLRHLFSPAVLSKRQEREHEERGLPNGLFSFLPPSRAKLYKIATVINESQRRTEAELRAEVASLKKAVQITREESTGGLHDLRRHLSGSVATTGALQNDLGSLKASLAGAQSKLASLSQALDAISRNNGEAAEKVQSDLVSLRERVEETLSEHEERLSEEARRLDDALEAQSQRLEVAESRVDDALSSRVDDLEKAAETAEESAAMQARKVDEVTARLDEAVARQLQEIESVTKRLDDAIADQSARGAAIEGQTTRNEERASRLEQEVAALTARLEDELPEIEKTLATISDEKLVKLAMRIRDLGEGVLPELRQLQEKTGADLETLGTSVSATTEALDTLKQAVEADRTKTSEFIAGANHDKRFLADANGRSWRVHDRFLTAEEISHFQNNWMRPLGLFLTNKQLGYMANRIALAEERCEGRMATTIQAAMVRALALLSLQSRSIELLEIGTLFGIGSGVLHEIARRDGREMNLTLLDPLDGYYGQKLKDDATGVPITRDTLVGNLDAMGVPADDYRIIQQLSTEDQALEEAGDRQYDYLLIDGDHSLEGVAADFDLYGPMVKPGGVVIFDDYDTKDWPAIKQYVDENVRDLDDWLWVGGEFRTAILRKRRKASKA